MGGGLVKIWYQTSRTKNGTFQKEQKEPLFCGFYRYVDFAKY
jgi:hypothetical protein